MANGDRSGVELPEGVKLYFEREGLSGPGVVVLPLAGDASTRRYFRVIERGQSRCVISALP